MRGFHRYQLNSTEVLLLSAFDRKYGELLCPIEALKGMQTPSRVLTAIASLRRQQLIVGDRPLKLTNKGIELRKKLERESRYSRT
jgi:hypothetical protein